MINKMEVRHIKRKTTEEFKQEIYNLVGNEYELIGEYVNAQTKVLIKHNKCGNTNEILPNNFLRNKNGCPVCAVANRTKTHEKYIKEVYDLVQDEYKILGEYSGNKKKILMKHISCENEFYMKPNSFLRGQRCPKCGIKSRSIKNTKPHDQFINEIFNKYGEEYSILEQYINGHTKILVRHNECGHEYKVRPNDMVNGRKCPKCYRNFKKTTEQYKQEVYDKVGNEYTVLGEYENNRVKILIKHNECGYEYKVNPKSFLHADRRCPKCAIVETRLKLMKEHEVFLEEVYKLVGDKFTVLSEYNGNKNKVKFMHNECNHVFEMTPNAFLRGNRCPRCCKSKGETRIMKWLDENNVKYIDEYDKFEELRGVNNGLLRYDFAILNEDGTISCLIEYQGEQHYKHFERWVTKLQHIDLKIHDKRKYIHCCKYRIKFIRIPYWDYENIETILEKELLSNNK